MNRRLCVWVVSILCGFCSLTAVQRAFGQATPAVTMPPGVQGNPVESPADVLGINTFINTQYALLSGTDPVAQTIARKALMTALPRGGTPVFYTTFSKAWTSAVNAGMKTSPPVAVRLNIGIVTRELADNGQATNGQPLDPSTESLVVNILGDNNACVALWGVKAARPMVQQLLMQGTPGQASPPVLTQPLVAALVKAVKSNGKSDVSGFMTSDAYLALAVDQIPGQNAVQVAAVVPPLVGPILDILEFRLSQFKDGVTPDSTGKLGAVQSPAAEKSIGTFLSVQKTPANEKRIVQDLVNLLSFLGQRAVLYQNSTYDLAQIRETLRYTASALKVLVPSIATTKELAWFFPPPPACTPKDMLDHTKVIYGLIHVDPGFTTIAVPSVVAPIDPPPYVDPSKPVAAPGAAGTPAPANPTP